MGNDSTQIYSYNFSIAKKEIVFDLAALMEKAHLTLVKGPALAGAAILQAAEATSKGVKSGLSRTAGFILGSIILMARWVQTDNLKPIAIVLN